MIPPPTSPSPPAAVCARSASPTPPIFSASCAPRGSRSSRSSGRRAALAAPAPAGKPGRVLSARRSTLSSVNTTLALACTLSLGAAAVAAPDYPIQPVPFTAVRLTGGFWHARQEINRTVTVPFALQQCEDTGRVRNFDLAAETMRRRAAGETTFQHKPPTVFPFDDSDVFKALEGAAYALSLRPDAALERRLDTLIARIAAAQEPDGYLYTWRTMHPDSPAHKWIDRERW
ncbi:MAG: hypothetical protein FJ399_02950, partial [Verrucomicrobia bacterium]|nr:hypothetical protein [Verrucomicrobiota bacterium]